MLKKINNKAKYNMMKDITFFLTGQPIPIDDCYIYLSIPFDKTLSLNPVVKINDLIYF